MNRLVAAVALLCTQILAVFSAGNVVVCIHEDGACAIELIGSECCRDAREAERHRPAASADERAAMVASDADRCRDVPWHHDQTLLSRGTDVRTAPSHEVQTAPYAFVAWTSPARFSALQFERPSVRAPPPAHVPRSVRTFILRC